MDQLFFHPKVVHLPMALAVLMPLVTGGVLFAWWRGWFQRRVWVGRLVAASRLGWIGRGRNEHRAKGRKSGSNRSSRRSTSKRTKRRPKPSFGRALRCSLDGCAASAPEGSGRVTRSVHGSLSWHADRFRFGLPGRGGGGRLVYQHGAAQAYVTNGGVTVPASDESLEGDSDSH